MTANPVAPDLVADLPIANTVWLRVSVRGTPLSVLGGCRPVAVLDPRRGFLRRRAAAFDVDRDGGLRADVAGEPDEFIGAEVAGLGLVLPGQVDPGRAGIPRSDAPAPVVVLGDVAARPADERGTERSHLLQHVGAHVVHGVTGYE